MSRLIDYVWDKEHAVLAEVFFLISVLLIHWHTVSSGTRIAGLQMFDNFDKRKGMRH